MAKIKLHQEQTKIDLMSLLSTDENVVPTIVPTNEVVPTIVPTIVPTKLGRFDSYAKDYPESVKVRLKLGTTDLLKKSAKDRGFSSVSKLIRSALLYALSHEDFVDGWDKQEN